MIQKLSLTLSLLALATLTAQECCDLCGPETIVFSAQHRFGRGVGYKDGYSSLDFFYAPFNQTCVGLPFLDIRGHVFDNGRWAANAGLGWRYLGPSSCWIWGANVYYDYRRSHEHNFQQVSFGIEALSANWELRANGYVPVGKKLHARSHFSEFSFLEFSGNNILIQQHEKRKFEEAMEGVDAEVGYHFWRGGCFDLYAGIGPYYFRGEHNHKDAIGGKARITAQISDYLTLEVSDSWDSLFHNRPQGLIALNLPLGPSAKVTRTNPDCCECPEILLDRLYQPVEKQEIIVLSNKTKHFDIQEVAIDPTTELPWFVIFVDNTADPAGTFEDPYNTLLLAQNNSKPNDIIYVFPGDGTTTGMDMGITLQNNQLFWGSGVSHLLETTEGPITIPALTTNSPTMTSGGDGVDLATNNEVVGFNIFGVNQNGIFGADVGTLLIANNDISLSGNQGVAIFGTMGPSTITALNNTFSQNGQDGFALGSGGTAVVSLDFEENTVFLNARNGLEFDTTSTAVVTALIKNNTLQENVNGVAIFYDDFPTSLTATIDSNTMSNNSQDGILTAPFVLGGQSATKIACQVTNNEINENGVNGIEMYYSNNSQISTDLIGNSVNRNAIKGFYLNSIAVNTSLGTNYVNDLTFLGNDMQSNHSIGIQAEMVNDVGGATTGQLNLFVRGNALSNQANTALEILYQGASSLSATIKDNAMNSCGNNAFVVDALGNVTPDLAATSLTMTLINNELNANTGEAMFISYGNNTHLDATINSNVISHNGNIGIFVINSFAFDRSSPANYQITCVTSGNDIEDNASFGSEVLFINGASGTAHATLTASANTFVNNDLEYFSALGDITVGQNGAIDWSINFTDNTLTGAGVNIFAEKFQDNTAFSTTSALVENNTINNPTQSGIFIAADDIGSNANTVTMNAQILGNTINSSAHEGIDLETLSGASGGTAPLVFNASAIGNTMENNTFGDFFADFDQPNGFFCVFLEDNRTSNGFTLVQHNGTFTYDDAGGNIGTISTFNAVNPGTCPSHPEE